MRRSIPILCGCLALGWAGAVAASEGPPVQRPGQAKPAVESVEPAVVEPAPVEPAPVEPPPVTPVPAEPSPVSIVPAPSGSQLPRYDTPIVREPPAPTKPPRDRKSERLITAGSVLFCAGFPPTILGGLLWLDESQWGIRQTPGPRVAVGLGLLSIATGATLLGIGISRHKRWKQSLAGGPARVQVQPTIGFGQLGVVGRF